MGVTPFPKMTIKRRSAAIGRGSVGGNNLMTLAWQLSWRIATCDTLREIEGDPLVSPLLVYAGNGKYKSFDALFTT